MAGAASGRPWRATISTITLSKTETRLLVEAADRGGAFETPASMKPSTRERTLGRLVRDGLVATGEAGHLLTAAGYRAVGLKPPRVKRSAAAASAESTEPTAPRATKGALVLDLLGRGEGASLAELTEATGWLPHTTRAALSRIRSSGTPLAKSKREDGVATYRIVADEPAPAKRQGRPRAAEAASAASA